MLGLKGRSKGGAVGGLQHHDGRVSAVVPQVEEALELDVGGREALRAQLGAKLRLELRVPLVAARCRVVRTMRERRRLLRFDDNVGEGDTNGRQDGRLPVHEDMAHPESARDGAGMLAARAAEAGEYMG